METVCNERREEWKRGPVVVVMVLCWAKPWVEGVRCAARPIWASSSFEDTFSCEQGEDPATGALPGRLSH